MPKPTAFGRYLLLDRIAYGGMAEVFRATQFGEEGFDRIIAIKRVLPELGARQEVDLDAHVPERGHQYRRRGEVGVL